MTTDATRAGDERTRRWQAGSWLVRILPPLLIVAAVFAAFAPALSAEFVAWDDDTNFLHNQAWRGLSAHNLAWMFTTFHMGPYQPLSWVTLGADYELWGLHGPGFHLTNVVLHALTAVAFWYTVRRLFVAVHGSDCWFAALVATLVFAVHPLRVESVAWVTERRDVLSGLFFVLAIGAWVRYAHEGRRASYWIAFALVLLSLLAKASAIVVPALLLVLDVWPLKRTVLGWRRLLVEKLPFAAASVVFGWLAIHGQSQQGRTLMGLEYHGIPERAAQAAFGLVFYAWRTLVPRNLIPIHELPAPFDVGSARFVVPIVAVIVAVIVLVIVRKRAPALVTAALAYAVILAPVSGITQAGPQLVADRYSYLACMPFAILAGCAVAWVLSARPDARAIVVATVVVVTTVLGVLTFRQSRYWRDSEALWRRTIAISPASPTARINLGAVLVQRGVETQDPVERERLWNEAQAHLELGLAVHPDPQMHINLGLLALLRAQYDPDNRLSLSAQAIEAIDRGLALGQAQASFRPEWQLARASALMAAGRCPEAVVILESLVRTAPATESVPRTLALAYACAGRKDAALDWLGEALRVDPSDVTLWLRAGELAAELGRREDARSAFRRALDLRRAQVGAEATKDAQWKQARQALDQLH